MGLLHGRSNLVKLCWCGDHGFTTHKYHKYHKYHDQSHINFSLHHLDFQLWMCGWRTPNGMESGRAFWLQLLPRTWCRLHQSLGVLCTCSDPQHMLLLRSWPAAEGKSPKTWPWTWTWSTCSHSEHQRSGKNFRRFWTLRALKLWRTWAVHSNSGWCIHPWPWLLWIWIWRFSFRCGKAWKLTSKFIRKICGKLYDAICRIWCCYVLQMDLLTTFLLAAPYIYLGDRSG